MCNVSTTVRKDFSSYVLIRNLLLPSNAIISRNELKVQMKSFPKLLKFRFQEDINNSWETAFAMFEDVTSAEAAIDFLNLKGAIVAGFMRSLFELYDDMEKRIQPICHSTSVISVQARNINISPSELRKLFDSYGEICNFDFGATTFISYKHFSNCLAAEVDNNKWNGYTCYFTVTTLRYLKEYVLGFLIVVDNYTINKEPEPSSEKNLEYPYVPLPEGPQTVNEQHGEGYNLTEKLINVLKTKFSGNTSEALAKNFNSKLPFDPDDYKFYLMVTDSRNNLSNPAEVQNDTKVEPIYCSISPLVTGCSDDTVEVSDASCLLKCCLSDNSERRTKDSDVDNHISSPQPPMYIHGKGTSELYPPFTLNSTSYPDNALNSEVHYTYPNYVQPPSVVRSKPNVMHPMVAKNFEQYAYKSNFLPGLKASDFPVSYSSKASCHANKKSPTKPEQLKKVLQSTAYSGMEFNSQSISPTFDENNFPSLQQGIQQAVNFRVGGKCLKFKQRSKSLRHITTSEYIEKVFNFPKYSKSKNNLMGKSQENYQKTNRLKTLAT